MLSLFRIYLLIKSNINNYITSVLIALFFSSCVGLNINPDEKLYWDNEVKINYDLEKREAKKVTKKLKSYINPRPVRHTIGMFFKTAFFKPDSNYRKKEDIKYGYLRQEPTIYSKENLKRGKLILENVLNNQGYFGTQIDADTTMQGDLKVVQNFTIQENKRFWIARVDYHCDEPDVLRLIRDEYPTPYLKTNTPLSHGLSDLEKKRIRNLMLEKGYFKADWVKIDVGFDTLYKADADSFAKVYPDSYADTLTSSKDKIAIVSIRIVQPAESDTLDKYFLDSTYVEVTNFSTKGVQDYVRDTVGTMVVSRPRPSLPLDLIVDNIYGEHGDLFSVSDIKNTQRKLNQYGYFQSTDNIIDRQTEGTDSLNRYYTLKLRKMKSLGGNINVYQSSLGGGLQINTNYVNRNLGHKGVKFEFSPSFSFDLTVPNDTARFPNTSLREMIVDRTLGTSFELSLPKILFPGVSIPKDRNYFSETDLTFYISNNNRTSTFNFMNYVATFGYNYKPNSKASFEFNPLFCNITDYLFKSDEFQRELDTNFFLRQTFASNFILGEFLGFSIGNSNSGKRTNRYLSFSVEEAGGIIQLIEALGADFTKRKYAKYWKFDLNTSILQSRKKSAIGARLLIGAGFLRADNRALPFVKQYVIGGPYELRGFRVRAIGPGHYKDTTYSVTNIYQTADIKLVLNNEYRFDIVKSGSIGAEGALFADVGNIWTSQYDESRPGSQFRFENLYKDLAISIGWGIRVNIANLLLLRVDFGTRVKFPDYWDQNSGWIQNSENLNFLNLYKSYTTGQIAVGYPF